MAIATEPVEINYASQTDRGRQRELNEDFVFADDLKTRTDGRKRGWLLLAVADGVGGHQRGEWASEKAVGVLRESLPGLLETMEPAAALTASCQAANTRTWQEASESGLDGSATTLVVALVSDADEMWLANVGDSRAYLVKDGSISQLTTDHTWVEEQVQSGRMSSEEARTSEQRNIITRSVGFSESVEVDVTGPARLRTGERLILCSDGLYDLVADSEIALAVSANSPDKASRRLVDLANERGGSDNVSVIVCSVDSASSPVNSTQAGLPPVDPHASGVWLLVVLVAFFLFAGAALILLFAR